MIKTIDVPKLRFPEFDLAWNRSTIDTSRIKIIDGDRGINYPNGNDFSIGEGYCLFLNAKNVTKTGFDFREKAFITNIKDEQLRKGKLVLNDIVLTTRGTVGNIAFYNEDVPYRNIRINSGMVIIRNENPEISHNYFYILLSSPEIKNRFLKISFGSAQPQLTVSQIIKLEICYPSIAEQQKIAQFLTSVENKIQQLSRKKRLLEKYKKGVSQQIFNQEIRFKNYEGNDFPEWEGKKLGEVATITMGQSPNSNSYNTNKIGMLLIQGNADISDRKTKPRNWTSAPTKVCNVGDIIMTVRAPVGAIALSKHNACIGRGVCAIRNNEKSHMTFLYQTLLLFETKWAKVEQGSTFTAVSGSDIKSMNLEVPCLIEQQKIADFLTLIDKKIDNITQQLQQAKHFKKSLLQQMFI